MLLCQLEKIVSGGQTGVDRAALDVAIFLDIPHGGWCPQGRRSENGVIPSTYKLKETKERDYSVRTERNVVESDATLILFWNQMMGGTELTRKMALKHHRALFCVDLEIVGDEDLRNVRAWINKHSIRVLNVAGPRESTCEGIGRQSEQFLVNAFTVEREQ